MYHKIMIPVDLAHVERLEKALRTGADLAKLYDLPVCYVGVTADAPGPAGRTPNEYAGKLQTFAEEQGRQRGLNQFSAKGYLCNDPVADLDKVLLDAIKEQKADLVVMASHVPGLAEHLFASNGGYVASHAKVSVLVVR